MKLQFPPYLPDGGPRYWRNEQTGRLKAAIEAYLDNRLHQTQISPTDCELVKAYLCHWVNAPIWDRNPYHAGDRELAELRAATARMTDADSIAQWIQMALNIGIDPL